MSVLGDRRDGRFARAGSDGDRCTELRRRLVVVSRRWDRLAVSTLGAGSPSVEELDICKSDSSDNAEARE
jgi:hypothetical protein